MSRPFAATVSRPPFSRDCDLLFCSDTGRTVGHRNLIGRGLPKAATRAGLSGVSFHVLRHTFASILIDQGHDVVFVSRQLGHANPSITLKAYAHLFDAERHADRARAQLDADYGALYLAGEPGGIRNCVSLFRCLAQPIGSGISASTRRPTRSFDRRQKRTKRKPPA